MIKRGDATLGEALTELETVLTDYAEAKKQPMGRTSYVRNDFAEDFGRACWTYQDEIMAALRAFVPSESATTDEEIDALALKVIYSLPAPMLPSHREDSIAILRGALRQLAQRSATEPTPIGLFWQTADGRWHFSPGSFKRGDIHDNGRPIRIAYIGEEAK